MSSYLMIENCGVACPTSFTLFGASTKRNSSAHVGQFGTGGKQSIALLLRKGLSPTIYCGNLKMDFGTKPVVSNGASFEQVTVKYSGKDEDGRTHNRTEELSFVVDNGAIDWDHPAMAMREFVSNAIDGAIDQLGTDPLTYMKGVRVELVSHNQVRAKAGTTRVFVPAGVDVVAFFRNIHRWFLHFSEPESLGQQVLPKANRNLKSDSQNAVIYRRGVLVREYTHNESPSLFDYNLDDLPMDESRKIDDWSACFYAGLALSKSDPQTLAKVIGSHTEGRPYWEHTLNYGLTAGTDDQKKLWREAFDLVAGDKGVLCAGGCGELAARKGYTPIILPEAYREALEKAGVRNSNAIFSEDERNGRTVKPATKQAVVALDFVWDLIKQAELDGNKPKPEVKCFHQHSSGGAITMGFVRLGEPVIYINEDIAADVDTKPHNLPRNLLITMLEEVCHYCSNSNDFTRDFQNFIFDLIVRIVQ